MDKLEKQILRNQLEIMNFLSGFRTLVENIEIDGKVVDEHGDGGSWVFSKCAKETEELLKE